MIRRVGTMAGISNWRRRARIDQRQDGGTKAGRQRVLQATQRWKATGKNRQRGGASGPQDVAVASGPAALLRESLKQGPCRVDFHAFSLNSFRAAASFLLPDSDKGSGEGRE